VKGKLLERKPPIQLHLSALTESCSHCFPEQRYGVLKKIVWIRDSFAFENFESAIVLNLTPEEGEWLHHHFMLTLKKRFLLQSKKNVLLLLFTVTCMCLPGFLTLT
jgi:hypothetical protein